MEPTQTLPEGGAAKLAVVTSTRAEYGLLRPVIRKLLASPGIVPLVAATGAHLSAAHGMTVRELEADGVPIAARIPILPDAPAGAVAGGTPVREDISAITARTIEKFSRWFGEACPDAVLLLGDRYEIFAVAVAAAQCHIPICHISGGDVTLGAADEYYRHCITKMAAVHFPSCTESAARVVRLGEDPARVFCVGGLGDENIRTLPKMTREELCKSTGLPQLAGPFALVTYHPETAGEAARTGPAEQCRALCAAMAATERVFWLITGSNADAGGQVCNAAMQAFAAAHPGRAAFVQSLGLKRYLSAMGYAALVAGNSSSGVVETPSFGVPTVNVGSRQAGRAVCANVLCCGHTEAEITAALQAALTPAFAARAKTAKSPYNGGDTSGRIVAILEQQFRQLRQTGGGLLAPGAPKAFYDGPVPEFTL